MQLFQRSFETTTHTDASNFVLVCSTNKQLIGHSPNACICLLSNTGLLFSFDNYGYI